MNWADLIVVAIILVSVIISAKRGFARSVIGVFSIVISLLIASFAYPIASNYIESSELKTVIAQKVEESLGVEDEIIMEKTEEEKDFLFFPKAMQKSIENKTKEIEQTAKKTTAQTVTTLIINLISIISVFLIVRILMFILTHLLNLLTKIPIIKGFNKLLGGALGLLTGAFIVYLLFAILTFSSALNQNEVIIKEIKDSRIASQMYDNNLLVNIIS
ncbi:MAG: CvpA family protein [Clostridia bacterium]|nr:CvpA family protein [Clostridia bacterium]